eukprot:TRINITY_DN21393_c0_g1_i1.p2 TRINITY_DN21393_c0_g1~~TRINITY_DN21393_c0_g1_i1.p2  ORF type:complete len:143 (-),score=37.90 TRINITY_DN21393_c0_g1_i1:218-646(-)
MKENYFQKLKLIIWRGRMSKKVKIIAIILIFAIIGAVIVVLNKGEKEVEHKTETQIRREKEIEEYKEQVLEKRKEMLKRKEEYNKRIKKIKKNLMKKIALLSQTTDLEDRIKLEAEIEKLMMQNGPTDDIEEILSKIGEVKK